MASLCSLETDRFRNLDVNLYETFELTWSKFLTAKIQSQPEGRVDRQIISELGNAWRFLKVLYNVERVIKLRDR